MVTAPSPPSTAESLARWEADGGATFRAADHTRAVVRFLGLSDVVELRSGGAAFELGILYPYTADLRRVCLAFESACRAVPGAGAALLAAIATLHRRIAFAPGGAAATVEDAHRAVEKALQSHPHGVASLLVEDGTSVETRLAARSGGLS